MTMKTSKNCWLVLSMVASLCAFVHGQDADVLLSEGFESGTEAPDQWETGMEIEGAYYVYDKSKAKSGERSLSLQKSAQRYFPIAEWSRTLELEHICSKVKVTSQVLAEKTTKARLDIIFLDGNGERLSKEYAATVGTQGSVADHDWKEYSTVLDVPAAAREIQISLQMFGPGKVWFDDIEVTLIGEKSKLAMQPAVEEVKGNVPGDAVAVQIGDSVGHYLTVPARASDAPPKGYGILIVLPGGDGSSDFHPFIKNIHAQSVSDEFVLAQPLSKAWTKNQFQMIVWPTKKSKVKKMEYSTEELIAAVVADVSEKNKVDPDRVYVLAWSSSGPAVYAALLDKKVPVAGAMIAMSVFFPNQLPPLENARGKSIYIFHSRKDPVCRFPLAKQAFDSFTELGVRTKMTEYQGGHGWHGDMLGNIRAGIDWLEEGTADEGATKADRKATDKGAAKAERKSAGGDEK